MACWGQYRCAIVGQLWGTRLPRLLVVPRQRRRCLLVVPRQRRRWVAQTGLAQLLRRLMRRRLVATWFCLTHRDERSTSGHFQNTTLGTLINFHWAVVDVLNGSRAAGFLRLA